MPRNRRWTAEDIAKLSPRHQQQVREAFARGEPTAPAVEVPAAAGKRLRQSGEPILNALETRFLAKLKKDFPGHAILAQAVRLELARGIWYKPDFFLPEGYYHNCEKLTPAAYEVKGPKAFRGGFENLKVAARVHPWVKFFLVWEDPASGAWNRQEVLS